tara:strand:- start:2166 stop:3893 length:1728 start_codon:yes stop_codon:yes gene_type:complete
MPILSAEDRRFYLQNLPTQGQIEPDFFETLTSAFDFVIDEELSISSLLNNQGYDDRTEQIREMVNGGFNLKPYTNVVGEIDYARLSADTGTVKSDRELWGERRDILAERRAENQDVMERGSGLAQFLGSMGGYMLDPINIATFPISIGTAYKGMSILSRALMTGRDAAGVAIATELAIQPLVYQHKNAIGSPYEFNDALMAISTAAIGSALLGTAAGGIQGYLQKVKEKTAFIDVDKNIVKQGDNFFVKQEVDVNGEKSIELKQITTEEAEVFLKTNEISESLNILASIEEQLSLKKDPRVTDDLLKAYDDITATEGVSGWDVGSSTDLKIRKELEKVLNDKQKELQKSQTFAQFFDSRGKLNTQSFIDAGLDKKDLNEFNANYQIGKQFFSSNGKLTVGGVNDQLRDMSYPYWDSTDAYYPIKLVADIFQNPKKMVDDTVDAELAEIQQRFDDLQQESDTPFFIQRLIEEDVELDANILRQNQETTERLQKPTLAYEDYVVEQLPTAPIATKTSLQRHLLDDEGLAEFYDRDIANFNALDIDYIKIDGIKPKEYMKALDDQIDGIESVRVCALG